jgi:hypothetical protein
MNIILAAAALAASTAIAAIGLGATAHASAVYACSNGQLRADCKGDFKPILEDQRIAITNRSAP